MSDDNDKTDNGQDGEKVKDSDTETKEPRETKQRSVSFNRDVHVKRFGKPRETRGASNESPVRKEPFTHLSKEELIEEANKVLAQAESVTCTADHPPEKFFSLPHRKKPREDRLGRRNSDDVGTPEEKGKSPLGRSTSDVSPKRRRERTSLSTLFRRAQKNKGETDAPIAVSTKPIAIVKRSKSDVSDLKSNTNLNTPAKYIRKRSGSETEEFLKSLRNKKTQLSPIIESSPRDDYFRKTPPLDIYQKQKLSQKDSKKSEEQSLTKERKVNPVLKPPRYKIPETQEPKPPARTKRGKSLEKDKEKHQPITETPKRKTDIKKTLLIDEIDSKSKDLNRAEVKDRIKDSIRKIEENVYGTKDMIHSSQQPPDKLPLTRGHTVDHIVKILKEDQNSTPKANLIVPPNGSNINQPFSYTKPSVSPDPNLFARTTPDRVPTPVNKMTDKGVVYAHVVRDHNDENGKSNIGKQTIHKTFSPPRDKYGSMSDEDEGLGYEERHKYSPTRNYSHDFKTEPNDEYSLGYKIIDSPIRPRFREYKLTNFNNFEPTYANEYPSKQDNSDDFIETFRGRADGMDTKKKFDNETSKADLDFNELSYRRQLLESRLNARRNDKITSVEPMSRYIVEPDPIYEAEKRMKATEKYVNETARYYHHTLEKDGLLEDNITENYNKYDSDNFKVKYNTETRTFQKVPKGELDRREFINNLEPKTKYKSDKKLFPPEPEYEPPSLEFNTGKPLLAPDEYTEKKYRVKKNVTSSHDVLQTGQRYKKDEWFGKRKGHYASNPEIAQEREDEYANLRYNPKNTELYHNSLQRVKNKDKYKNTVHRHDSGDSQDYYRDNLSPRRLDYDSRLIDSGIENDFRKDSGEIHRRRIHESDDDVRDTSLFLASERRHTEDNYPSEQIYANGEYLARFSDYRDDDYRKEYSPREMSADDGSHFDSKGHRYDRSPSRHDDKVSAKPPKATKKLSGLEKMKQLFSRDSSKKSKKEKEAVQQKTRTRVLKSPEHLARKDSDYRRYTDPEPSDIEVKKIDYDCKADERRYRSSKEDVRYRSSDPRDSDVERKYRTDYDRRYDITKEDRRYKERRDEKRRYHSSDRESDQHSRPSDVESDLRKSRSKTLGPYDSPALAERYRERRRLATPSPTPPPPRRAAPPVAPPSSGNWFKSLDRLARKRGKNKENAKVEKESILTTEDESTRKSWSKPKSTNSPAKNLRFFGDTDQESDVNVKQVVGKSNSHPQHKATLRKTLSNSSAGLDEVDRSDLSSKSYSLSNLHREEKSTKRNLHNISEGHSNSEVESQFGRKMLSKPPISPYDRRSRSHSSSKTLKGSKGDLRRDRRVEERGSSSELRSSKQELSNLKPRRRTPGTNSGESSTEGDSSHQSQRSVVYLHATTVGDIPDPGRITRNRSRDDVSSVNSSNLQVRSTTKSFSIFAPWTPRHYSDQHDLHYAQRPRKQQIITTKENPLQKKKSYSQTTLTKRPQNNRLSSSNTTLYRKPEKRKETPSTLRRTKERDNKRSQSSEVLNRDGDRERISRSISIPKDGNKKAGWFKLTNKNKKQENNTRVR